jgi:hypothetical protein
MRFVTSVRPSVFSHVAAPTGRIFVKFRIGEFYENVSRDSKVGQYRALHVKT